VRNSRVAQDELTEARRRPIVIVSASMPALVAREML
jgi:hypothetical protein